MKRNTIDGSHEEMEPIISRDPFPAFSSDGRRTEHIPATLETTVNVVGLGTMSSAVKSSGFETI